MKSLTQHITEKLRIGKDWKPGDFETLVKSHNWMLLPNGTLKCSDENVFNDIADYIDTEGTELDDDYVEEILNQGECVCCVSMGSEEIQLVCRFKKNVDLYDALFFWVVGEVNKKQVILQNQQQLNRRFVRCLNSTSDMLSNVNGRAPKWYSLSKEMFTDIRNWYKSIPYK